MKLRVDADRCTGHGRCYSLAPGLLTCDDEGFVSIRGSAVDVPPGYEDEAHDAAISCPEGAITVEE